MKFKLVIDPRTFVARFRTGLTISAAVLPILALFFRPSFVELFVFYLVEAFSFLLFARIDPWLFRSLYPETSLYFPLIARRIFSFKSLEERAGLFQSIMAFPAKRAAYMGVCALFLILPGFAFIFLSWSNAQWVTETFVKCVLLSAIVLTFFMSMTYLESHDRMTRALRAIHTEANWSDLFRSLKIPRSESQLARFENLCLFSIMFFCLCLLIMIHNENGLSKGLSTLEITTVMFSALLMVWQLMYVSRSFMREGMSSLVNYYRNVKYGFGGTGLALSTYPALARFEQALNDAVAKRVASEREMHQWIMAKAEDHRFLSLGRLTGLLMHDLVNPISAIRLRLRNLYKKIPADHLDEIKKIEFGLNSVMEMVLNVRNSIRDQTTHTNSSRFRVAHENAMELVKFVFKSGDEQAFLSRVLIDLDEEWDAVTNIPHIEMTQILVNLYQNSLVNMLQNQVLDARLLISCLKESDDELTLSLIDTGTGLSAEIFQRLTEGPERMPGAGIGLKLTRRLVERYGGALRVAERGKGRGTHFLLTVRRGSSDEFTPVPWLMPANKNGDAPILES